MERHVVVGTAGHIDHGKTALVRALTGVDTDRLAEEKRRGITIDLGFAPLALGAVRASVVDVPGHEAFIRNMVAGATGVDLALLVVAADEGVMPQTIEHLDILRVLGVRRGVVALTKCDLPSEAGWRDLVAEDVRSAVAARFDSPWPLVEVSARSGAGLGPLRAALESEAATVPPRETEDRFRMPVDRTFALAGAGTIVTGTVWSGSVAEGDHVLVLPAEVEARVRSVEVHGSRAARAEPGRRAALALVGLAREQAERGAVVVSGAGWRPSRAMDVALRLTDAGAVLRPRTRVRIHHGTAEVLARVVPAEAPDAGGSTIARLRLETPIAAARAGDRFVVRSYSPIRTLGGGVVLDPWADRLPRERGRRKAPPPAEAAAAERLRLLVGRRGVHGLTVAELEVAGGLGAPRFAVALEALCARDFARHGAFLVVASAVSEAAARLGESLAGYHRDRPLEAGMSAQAWRVSVAGLPSEVVELAESRLEAEGTIAREGALVRLDAWRPGGGESDARLRDALRRSLAEADAQPPGVGELEAAHPGADVRSALRFLAREGAVVAVGRDRYYEAQAFARERDRVVSILAAAGEATPAAVREKLGRSRKWLIPLLEHLDKEGVTDRRGDVRTLRRHQVS